MSLFNTPHRTLNPVFWTDEKTLRPEARQFFLDILKKIYPMDRVNAFVMIGSNVGYQYGATSDVDINMMAAPGESYEKWHTIFKQYHNIYPGTEHPVNLFFQQYTENDDWGNSLGAYDVLNNRWLKAPIPYDKIGNPAKRYEREIAYGNMLLSMIESEVEAIRRSVDTGNQSDIERRLKALAIMFHKIDMDRKASYKYRTGTPALQEQNILYKLIENSQYKDLFHELVETTDYEVF